MARLAPVILGRWVTRLGAVDVCLRENIRTMVAQRIDTPSDLKL
jgi:hypothetical protein